MSYISPEYRHSIPGPPESVVVYQQNSTFTPIGGLGGNTSSLVTGGVGSPSSGFMGYEVLVILVLLASLVVAILVLLGSEGAIIRGVVRRVLWGKSGGVKSLSGYRYEGLKAELRRVLEELISEAVKRGAPISKGLTASETAVLAESVGVRGSSVIARIYYEGVFSPRGATRSLVEKAWRLLKGER